VRSSILPAGFFSGGSGPKIIGAEEDDEEQEEEEEDRPTMKAGPSTSASVAPQASTAAASASAAAGQTGDEELDSFLASIAEPDPIIETSEEPPAPAPTAATQKAALGSTKKPTTSSYRDIIPGQASYEAAPVRNIPKDQEEQVAEPEVEESEAEKRARIAREEREEIMNRLEEEERAQ
jgi:zinc finger protein 830